MPPQDPVFIIKFANFKARCRPIETVWTRLAHIHPCSHIKHDQTMELSSCFAVFLWVFSFAVPPLPWRPPWTRGLPWSFRPPRPTPLVPSGESRHVPRRPPQPPSSPTTGPGAGRCWGGFLDVFGGFGKHLGTSLLPQWAFSYNLYNLKWTLSYYLFFLLISRQHAGKMLMTCGIKRWGCTGDS